jgi:hypothetical protein
VDFTGNKAKPVRIILGLVVFYGSGRQHEPEDESTDEHNRAARACPMSKCTRCGAEFGCAMADGADAPCWCTALPPVVPLPGVQAGCWCPACLKAHIASETDGRAEVPSTILK